jgi:3-hydroxymyristoyl/3-hydroxydecanoyl-(acyl carrier protein) dehydratase
MSGRLVDASHKKNVRSHFVNMPQMPGLVTGTALPQAGGKRHKKRKSTKQKGGFALAPILAGAAAVHAGLEKA